MKLILIFVYYWWEHSFQKEGVHALEGRFHAFEKVIHIFNKGVPHHKNNIIFVLLGSSFCEGCSHFWIKGFTFMKVK